MLFIYALSSPLVLGWALPRKGKVTPTLQQPSLTSNSTGNVTLEDSSTFLAPGASFQFNFVCGELPSSDCENAKASLAKVGNLVGSELLLKKAALVTIEFREFDQAEASSKGCVISKPGTQFRNLNLI